MFLRLFERFEVQNFLGFHLFIRSHSYSTAFIELLGLRIADSPTDSLISQTGAQKLDDDLNLIKSKALEILTHNMTYMNTKLERKQQMSCPYLDKLSGIIPILIKTA
jgi:hypothetical protein